MLRKVSAARGISVRSWFDCRWNLRAAHAGKTKGFPWLVVWNGQRVAGVIHKFSEGGIAGTHATLSESSVFVAPTTADGHNRVIAGDSSLSLAGASVTSVLLSIHLSCAPETAEEIVELKSLREKHKREIGSETPGAGERNRTISAAHDLLDMPTPLVTMNITRH